MTEGYFVRFLNCLPSLPSSQELSLHKRNSADFPVLETNAPQGKRIPHHWKYLFTLKLNPSILPFQSQNMSTEQT